MCKYEKVIAIILVVILFWLLFTPVERFDATTAEFVPLGAPRYGLRGDLLHQVPISTYFYPYKRQIRLTDNNNWMYESSIPINREPGSSSCVKTPCPAIGDYDTADTCWSCPPPTPSSPAKSHMCTQ